MMTLQWIDLHCPVCESVFESMAASANDEAGQDYYIDPSAPASIAIVMIVRRAMPNVRRRARPSCNLAISRHGATQTVTSVRGAHAFNLRLRWLTWTYPRATETTPSGPGVAFPCGVTGASSAQTSFDYPSSTCLLH
jgi:hypothetical protein